MYYERLMQVTGLTKQAGMEKAALSGERIFNTLMRGIGTPTKNGKINYKAINGILARLRGRAEAGLDNKIDQILAAKKGLEKPSIPLAGPPTAAQTAHGNTSADVWNRLAKSMGTREHVFDPPRISTLKDPDSAARAQTLWAMGHPARPIPESSMYFPGSSGQSYNSYLRSLKENGSPAALAEHMKLTGGDEDRAWRIANQAYKDTRAKYPDSYS